MPAAIEDFTFLFPGGRRCFGANATLDCVSHASGADVVFEADNKYGGPAGAETGGGGLKAGGGGRKTDIPPRGAFPT